MPTLLRFPDNAGRTRIEIYTQDHTPSHVHVNGVNKEAVLLLNSCETDETDTDRSPCAKSLDTGARN